MRDIGKKQIRKRGLYVDVETVELESVGEPVIEVRATVGESQYAMRWSAGTEGDVSPQRLQAEIDRLRDAVADEAARLEIVRTNLKLVS